MSSTLRFEAARALLDLGADANAYSDEDEATPLLLACRDAATDLSRSSSSSSSSLSVSALEAVLQVLLQQGGAQPNLRGGPKSRGRTAVQLLLENGMLGWADKMKALGVLLGHGARLDVPCCADPPTTGAQMIAALLKSDEGGRELKAALDSAISTAKSAWGVKTADGSEGSSHGSSGSSTSGSKATAAARVPEPIISRLLSKAAARPTIRPMATAPSSSSGGAGCCLLCGDAFNGLTKRPQHCRLCGHQVCAACSGKKLPLGNAGGGGNGEAARVCDGCFNWGSYHIGIALAAAAAKNASTESKDGCGFSGPEAVARARQRREETRAAQEAAEHKELFGAAASLGERAMSWLMGEGGGEEESRARRPRGAAAAQVTGQMEELRVGLQQRGERIENLADRTNELADSSAQFAAMARSLNEQSKGWGGLW